MSEEQIYRYGFWLLWAWLWFSLPILIALVTTTPRPPHGTAPEGDPRTIAESHPKASGSKTQKAPRPKPRGQ